MDESVVPTSTFSIRRLWPLALIALGTGLFFGFGFNRYVDIDTLREHREAIQLFVDDKAILAILIYIACYVMVTAVSCPAASILTLVGGFLFGVVGATGYTVVGATLGATIVFVAAKTSLGDQLRWRTTGFLRRMEDGFTANGFSYLLVLRLIPVFPFWVVNLVPAFAGMRIRIFVLGTFIGIVPGTAVYALAGSGLGEILDSNVPLSLSSILTPQVIGAFAGLAVLSLLPVVYKKLKGRGG